MSEQNLQAHFYWRKHMKYAIMEKCVQDVFARKLKQIEDKAQTEDQKKFATLWLRRAEIDLIEELGKVTERKTNHESKQF